MALRSNSFKTGPSELKVRCAMRLYLSCLFFMAMVVCSSARADTFPLSIPIEFRNNQIFLKVGINNAPPAWFILDSGASGCVVDTQVARRLKLKVGGNAHVTGAGKGSVQISFAADISYRLTGTRFSVPRSYVIDLSGQRTLVGRPVAGILGYDFFERYAVALDFEAGLMTLYATGAVDSEGRGKAVSFQIEKKTPHIPVRVKVAGHEPVEQRLLVDSGSADALDSDVLATAPARLEVVGGVGLGQEFRTVIGRADWAEIGGFRLDGPAGVAGGVPLIGMEILRRFDVVFDYANSRMFLKPNRTFSAPFPVDASGLDLRWTDDLKYFAVHDVAQNSPASDAGMTPADVIVAVNNLPASMIAIDRLQTLLTKDGSPVLLTVQCNGHLRYVTLVLRKRL